MSSNPSDQAPPLAGSSTQGNVSSILIVEDSRTAADLLGLFFESHGFDVAIAYDGEQAVQSTMLRCPQLVIMDLGLPELNGLHASMEIRKHHPDQDIRFVALSGYDDTDTVGKCLEYGFDSHVPKPAEPDQLLKLVRNLLKR